MYLAYGPPVSPLLETQMRLRIRRADIPADLRSMFELHGKEVVALALGHATKGGPGSGTLLTHVSRTILQFQDAAARWLQEQRDRDKLRDDVRFWGMLVLTFIAAVAAAIAAWPVIRG